MSVLSNNTLAGSSGQGGGGYEIERSLRFNSGDSASLTKSFSSAGNRKTWTLSFWTKRCFDSGNYQSYLMGSTDVTEGFNLRLNDPTDQKFYLATASGSGLTSDAVFRDFSAWMHVVIVYDSTDSTSTDRVKLYVNGERQTFGSGSYPSLNLDSEFNNSGDFGIGYHNGNTALDAYLAEYHFIDGQALSASDFGETDSNSVWQPIKYAGTYGTNGFHLDFSDTSSSAALGTDSANSNDWTVNNLTAASGVGPGITSTVPENLTGNWRGIIGIVPSGTSGAVAVFPDGGGTAQSRGTFYWTGLTIGDTITWYGTTGGTDSRGVTGNVDETSVSAPGSSLGTIQLTVNAASGSAKIDFNGTANCYGITPGPVSSEYNDALRDSPVNGDSANDTGAGGEITGNYCTWNPLGELTGGYVRVLSNGNLEAGGNGDSIGTITFGSGKTYFELTVTAASAFSQGYYGIVDTKQGGNRAWATTAIAAFRDTGSLYGASSTGSAPAAAAVGTVYGIAVDVDNQKMFISVNGTWLNSGNPASGTGASFTGRDFSDYAPLASLDSGNAQTITLNAGQRSWAYAAPTNYKALCTANLSDPLIADGSTAFDTKLYTGNAGTQAIGNLNFSPDLTWIKTRSGTGDHHLFDVIRGVNKSLHSNTSSATETTTAGLTAFNSNGFSIGNSNNDINGNGTAFVSWNWDAGSSNTSIAAGSISSGVPSIASTVRANPSAGFSIVSYTATSSTGTIAHGLNAAPAFVVCKRRDSTGNWWTGHVGAGWTKGAYLQVTDAFAALSGFWNNTAPDSNVVSLGSYPTTGSTSATYIAYCFAPVEGYSAFGTYLGNGSSPPFVYLGFRPRFVMVKCIDDSYLAHWFIWDSARSPYNFVSDEAALAANTYDTEGISNWNGNGPGDQAFDILSNGFKIRMAGTAGFNDNGDTYLYVAFAEHPYKTARAR